MRRRWILVVLALPVLFILAELGHRAIDALGSDPVKSVSAYDPSQPIPSVADTGFVRALAGLTQVALLTGHRIELLTDGPGTLNRLEQDLRSAQHSILFQTYYCEPGEVADRVKEVLIRK